MSQSGLRTIDDVYSKLHRYVYWLAHRCGTLGSSPSRSPTHVLLETDDLISELFLALVEAWNAYGHRKELDDDTLIRIVKVCLGNRVRTLVTTYYGTYRAEDLHLLDIYDPGVEEPTGSYDPEMLVAGNERFAKFLASLETLEREIVEAILFMDERVTRQAVLEGTRKSYVYGDRHVVSVNSNLVADALHLDRDECRAAWRSIEQKWRSYERTEIP